MSDRARAEGIGLEPDVQQQITAALDAVIVLVETERRAATGARYWNWSDVASTLRAAEAQFRNLPW